MWCLLQCSVCSRELLRPHLCRHFLLAFPLHAPCLGCTRVLLLEGFCPKSAKRNGRGKERRGEGTEEARRRKGKEEREKRTGPTRVLIIPQMRCSQGTKLTHKAHFPPSGTRSSPRMEYRNLPHVAVSVVAPQLQWSGTLGSTVLAFGIEKIDKICCEGFCNRLS